MSRLFKVLLGLAALAGEGVGLVASVVRRELR
jgi:hypothetical protein